MRPMCRLAPVLLGCAILTAGCAKLDFWKRPESLAAGAGGPCVGMVAPEIEGVDFEGRRFKLSDYRGNVVLLSFWSSGCRPCRDLIPYERALVDRYHDKPFVILGVNLDENPDLARKVISSQGISWRCWQAGGFDNSSVAYWKVNAIPALFVLDADGVIRNAHVHGPALDHAIDKLLAEVERKRAG